MDLIAPFIKFFYKQPYLFVIVFAIVVVLVYTFLVRFSGTSRNTIIAKIKHPNFFKEIRSILSDILLPLGFNEKEKMKSGHGIQEEKSVEFKLAEFTVFFWFNFKDSSYNLDIYHLSKDENGRIKIIQDYAIAADIRKADHFKSEVIEKLNDWIIKEGVKFRSPN